MISRSNFPFKKALFLLSTFVLIFLIFFDIGNLDQIRNQTETFYLKSYNLYLEGLNIPNPYHYPPLFLSFFKIIPSVDSFLPATNLRLFNATFSIGLLLIASQWASKNLKISTLYFFLFSFCSFGLLKYFQSYSPHMFLSFLNFFVFAFYYDGIFKKDMKKTLLSSLFFALSIPAGLDFSLYACLVPLFLYTFYQWLRYGFFPKKTISLWLLSSIFFISLFYFFSFIESPSFDSIFTTTFQLSFNRIFEVLFYLTPSIFFLPLFFSRPLIRKILRNKILSYFFFIFVVQNILFLFLDNPFNFHHILTTPLFSTIILFLLLHKKFSTRLDPSISSLVTMTFFLFSSLLLIIIFLSFSFSSITDRHSSLLNIILALVFLAATISILTFKRNSFSFIIISLLISSATWKLLIPAFYLPAIPEEVSHQIDNNYSGSTLGAFHNRVYYIEQRLNTPVRQLGPYASVEFLDTYQNSIVLIAPEYFFLYYDFESDIDIIDRWPTWKRHIQLSDTLNALRRQNLDLLKEYFLIVYRD